MLYCFKLLQSFSILAAISFSEASKLLVSTSAQRGQASQKRARPGSSVVASMEAGSGNVVTTL